MNNKSSSKKVELRKKAPFFCRKQNAAGTYDCLKPLAESDIFNLCPDCLVEFRAALGSKTEVVVPAQVAAKIEEDPNAWRPSGRTGPIWPTSDEPAVKRCGHAIHVEECPTCRESQQSNPVKLSGQEAK